MATVQIDESELRDVQFQASQYIPWKQEAERLADALYAVNPDHRILQGDQWLAYFAAKAAGNATGPAFEDGEPVDA